MVDIAGYPIIRRMRYGARLAERAARLDENRVNRTVQVALVASTSAIDQLPILQITPTWTRYPRDSGQIPSGRSAIEASELGGKASRGHRRDSRVGWDHLPEHFGMGAHDGGTSCFLGFFS
jgi:hypothetical protein